MRIRNNVAGRNYKGIVSWRTYAQKKKGDFKSFYHTECNVSLYEKIRSYIDASFGDKLYTKILPKRERVKGHETLEEARDTLEENL